MLAIIIAPFAVALLIFIFIRTINHFHQYYIKGYKVIDTVFALFLFGGIVSIILGFVIQNNYEYKRLFTKIGYFYVAVLLYICIGLAIALLIRELIWLLVNKRKEYNKSLARNITTIFVLAFTAFMMIYGINNAHDLRVTNYEIVSEKKSKLDELNIVLISDLHIGYNDGLKEMQDMVDTINNQNPDIVICAGDIFDNEYEAIENPEEMVKILSGINAKYGKYATYGNHDIQEKILLGFTFGNSKKEPVADERMVQFIKDSGFIELYDSYVMVEDIYIYGRPDSHRINFGNKTRLPASDIAKNLDKNKYIICVDHEPGELEQLANAGVDLDLSGHTHNGQFWPGTISIKWFWKNAYGLKLINNKMTSIVTSGVGLFGFDIRTGCIPEIVNIQLKFKK